MMADACDASLIYALLLAKYTYVFMPMTEALLFGKGELNPFWKAPF